MAAVAGCVTDQSVADSSGTLDQAHLLPLQHIPVLLVQVEALCSSRTRALGDVARKVAMKQAWEQCAGGLAGKQAGLRASEQAGHR